MAYSVSLGGQMWEKKHGSPMDLQGWNLDELDVMETDH
jgi:hypothetical protein